MAEDLLFIAKGLLQAVNSLDLTEEDKEQLVNTVRKILFILIFEWHKNKLPD